VYPSIKVLCDIIVKKRTEGGFAYMPIYEYACNGCGKHCEVIQKFSDEPLSNCPECGGQMHKLISQTSFILKGSGWYVTDYASSERKNARESDGSAGSKNQEASGTKAESKAETKTEPQTESTAKP
jgi:putative FmdB family regulatory protein